MLNASIDHSTPENNQQVNWTLTPNTHRHVPLTCRQAGGRVGGENQMQSKRRHEIGHHRLLYHWREKSPRKRSWWEIIATPRELNLHVAGGEGHSICFTPQSSDDGRETLETRAGHKTRQESRCLFRSLKVKDMLIFATLIKRGTILRT